MLPTESSRRSGPPVSTQLDRVVPLPDGADAPLDSVRIVVLASGDGTNLQALIDASGRQFAGSVALVVSDQPDAKALRRADKAGIPRQLVVKLAGERRRDYDRRLADAVAAADPDWVVLAGWMRLLSSDFLDRFPDHVVNLHPGLPGEYPGLRSIERAFDDAKAGLRDYTGLMVHLVPDEAVDDGPVLAMTEVPIFPDDSLESLANRMHLAEHDLLVRTVAQLPPTRRAEVRHTGEQSPPIASHPARPDAATHL